MPLCATRNYFTSAFAHEFTTAQRQLLKIKMKKKIAIVVENE